MNNQLVVLMVSKMQGNNTTEGHWLHRIWIRFLKDFQNSALWARWKGLSIPTRIGVIISQVDARMEEV
jgi:hypothetical protein